MGVEETGHQKIIFALLQLFMWILRYVNIIIKYLLLSPSPNMLEIVSNGK